MFSTRSLATHFCFRDCGLQNNVRLSLHLLWNVTTCQHLGTGAEYGNRVFELGA